MIETGWADVSGKFSNPNVKAVFSYKSFPTEGIEGRRQLAQQSGFISQNLIVPKQTHSNCVSYLNDFGRVDECDGIFSSNSDVVCSIQVADCLPIYFAHSSKPFVGLVHAGWRGLVNGILENSAQLILQHTTNKDKIDIWIGPSIQFCCFEVGDDVIHKFEPSYRISKGEGKYKINLQKIARDTLINAGFNDIKIQNSEDCTFCLEPTFHSYRRQGKKAGRMIGLIGIQ